MCDMDKNREIKPRIPVPLFTCNTALTFKKVPNSSYKRAKNLLFVAKSSNGKVSSRKEKKMDCDISENLPKDKFSLSEKLAEIYLEIAKKRKTRDRCFIKGNYLEELVMLEDLSYFIMKVYPTKLFLYYKNPYRVKYFYNAKVDEESDLFDSIDKEEIPACIFDQIMMCENWFLMYDYHCFLKIEKFGYEDEFAQPIFSEFVLLKPTIKLYIELVKKSAYETNNNNESSHEEPGEKYESKLCFEISGPLYLDTHPAAQELITLKKIYESPLGYTSLKDVLAERSLVSRQSEINPYQEELLKILEEVVEESSSSPKDMDFECTSSAFDYETGKEELQSFLDKRYVGVDTDDMCELAKFVESFELTAGNDCSPSELMKTYLSVFWKNGMFYSCLTLEKYIFDPSTSYDFLSLIGTKKDLDRYIFKVAEVLSCKHSMDLNIYYKNLITNMRLGLFFPIPEPESNPEAFKNYHDDSIKKKSRDTKYKELFNSEAFTKYHDYGTKKKSSDTKYDEQESLSNDSSNRKKFPFVMSYSDSDEEENDFSLFKNLPSHSSILQKSSDILKDSYTGEEIDDLIKLPSYFVKGPKAESVKIDNLSATGHSSRMETVLDHEENDFDLNHHIKNILISSLLEDVFCKTESQETPNLQRDHQSSVFGDRFKEEEKPNFDAVFKHDIKWNIEAYPPLNAKFEFSEEDFMKDIYHEHSEGIKCLMSELLPRNEDYL